MTLQVGSKTPVSTQNDELGLMAAMSIGLAASEHTKGQYAAAKKHWEHAFQLNPVLKSDLSKLFNYGSSLQLGEYLDLATDVFKQVITLDKDSGIASSSAHYNLAIIEQGRYTKEPDLLRKIMFLKSAIGHYMAGSKIVTDPNGQIITVPHRQKALETLELRM